MGNQSNALVDQFVNDYLREYDYHSEAARICHSRCEGILALRGIRAMITHRAKNPTKLRAKLEQRNKSKNYSSLESIRTDIIDLAGVRIALYFPGDRTEVAKLIAANFDVMAKRRFPIKKKREVSEDLMATMLIIFALK